MTTIDITKLTPEQRQQIAREEAEKAKNAKEQRKKNLEALEDIATETVPEAFKILKQASENMQEAKAAVFHLMKDYLQLKVEAFEAKSLQKSHTISCGNEKITLGYRVTDGYTDDANYGIAIIHEFIGNLGKDENSRKLTAAVLRLLSKNTKGDLDSKKVLELAAMANNEWSGTKLSEGVEIIQNAYRAKMSKWFIEASEVDGQGVERNIPLSITSADLPADFDLSFLLPKPEENE